MQRRIETLLGKAPCHLLPVDFSAELTHQNSELHQLPKFDGAPEIAAAIMHLRVDQMVQKCIGRGRHKERHAIDFHRLRARPDVDLNSYYVLALNKSPDISVIDPLVGFGGSKLLTLVMLKSPGEDWLLTREGEKLFVTLPLVNQVAVINTRNWFVETYIDTGDKPTRIIVQPDQQYVWVANEGGVTIIDRANLKVAAKIQTGAGRHDIFLEEQL